VDTTQTHHDEEEKDIKHHLRVLAESDLSVSDSADELLESMREEDV